MVQVHDTKKLTKKKKKRMSYKKQRICLEVKRMPVINKCDHIIGLRSNSPHMRDTKMRQ